MDFLHICDAEKKKRDASKELARKKEMLQEKISQLRMENEKVCKISQFFL